MAYGNFWQTEEQKSFVNVFIVVFLKFLFDKNCDKRLIIALKMKETHLEYSKNSSISIIITTTRNINNNNIIYIWKVCEVADACGRAEDLD